MVTRNDVVHRRAAPPAPRSPPVTELAQGRITMAILIIICLTIGLGFFAGTVLGYRAGVVDGRSLGRYQRHASWVDDLEHALAETSDRPTVELPKGDS